MLLAIVAKLPIALFAKVECIITQFKLSSASLNKFSYIAYELHQYIQAPISFHPAFALSPTGTQ